MAIQLYNNVWVRLPK